MRIFAAAICFCVTGLAQSVVIVNSGSTNTPGFQIEVAKSGESRYTARPRRIEPEGAVDPVEKTVSESLARVLYSDVETARPLTSLPSRRCPKSASFGTRLTVRFGDEESPDLSCGDGGNEKLRRLIEDVNAIVRLFRTR